MEFVSAIQAARSLARNDDDLTDRLSYRFTVTILILFALGVSTQTFVGETIKCWVPAHFTDNHEEFVNDYCWIRNTYYLPFENHIPKEHEEEGRIMIQYYQWVPIILTLQAVLTYLPCLFWRMLNGRSGIDVNNIVKNAQKFQDIDLKEEKEKTMRGLTRKMDRRATKRHGMAQIISRPSLLRQSKFRLADSNQKLAIQTSPMKRKKTPAMSLLRLGQRL